MTDVRFAPEVPDELAEAALWYEARRQGLGTEFLSEVETVFPSSEAALDPFHGLETWIPRLRSGGLCFPAFRMRWSSWCAKKSSASWQSPTPSGDRGIG